MTIEDAQIEKQKLRNNIIAMINEFSLKTNLTVDSIYVKDHAFTHSKPYGLVIDLELNIKL